MNSIFISYRKEDSEGWAVLLNKELSRVFGVAEIFLDKDTLGAGSWLTQIWGALAHAKVVLVVIGGEWLSAEDNNGNRRIDNPEDVHRREIAYALAQGVPVIPVLIDGTIMPDPALLPDDIRALTSWQACWLSANSARRKVDLKHLIHEIERLTGLKARVGIKALFDNLLVVLFVIGLILTAFPTFIRIWDLYIWCQLKSAQRAVQRLDSLVEGERNAKPMKPPLIDSEINYGPWGSEKLNATDVYSDARLIRRLLYYGKRLAAIDFYEYDDTKIVLKVRNHFDLIHRKYLIDEYDANGSLSKRHCPDGRETNCFLYGDNQKSPFPSIAIIFGYR